jgi:REP element-mobilizing transposase RayT
VPQSLAQLLAHVAFSTKNREPTIEDAIRRELHDHIGGIAKAHVGTLLKAESVADHIHLLLAFPRTHAPADPIQAIKSGSSKWLKTCGPRYRAFHWQSGYGIFSVSPGHRPALEACIDNQAEHHRTITFQDEYRKLLRKYGIEHDERYVWD